MPDVVVPWLGGCPHRERAWRWVRERYAAYPDLRVIEAPGSLPWRKAEAVMPAIEASSSPVVVMADADVWCDGLPEAISAVLHGAPWAIPHYAVHRLDADSTERFMAGHDTGLTLTQRPYRGWEGGGFVVARRETLLDVPMDPRFVGFGQEDESWALALRALVGPPWRGKAPLIHLWHPPQERISRRMGSEANWTLFKRYVGARKDPAAMRRLISEVRRDDRSADESSLHDHAGLR